jgi:tRNA (guanine37-N1)-methyltransferase
LLRIDIVTLFPEVFPGPLGASVVGRALGKGLLEIGTVNPRDFAEDKRGTVDDKVYGGGPGMLMKPEPLFKAVESVKRPESLVVLMSPRGERYCQETARSFARTEHLILICGHYEGVDERVRLTLADMEVSIGDYVLTSGVLPAMVVADSVARLLPGVLGSDESSESESFSEPELLEYPQYTRPETFRGARVPEVLLSGDHGAIAEWRRVESLRLSRERVSSGMKRGKGKEVGDTFD